MSSPTESPMSMPSALPFVRVPESGGFCTSTWLVAESMSTSVVVGGRTAEKTELP